MHDFVLQSIIIIWCLLSDAAMSLLLLLVHCIVSFTELSLVPPVMCGNVFRSVLDALKSIFIQVTFKLDVLVLIFRDDKNTGQIHSTFLFHKFKNYHPSKNAFHHFFPIFVHCTKPLFKIIIYCTVYNFKYDGWYNTSN